MNELLSAAVYNISYEQATCTSTVCSAVISTHGRGHCSTSHSSSTSTTTRSTGTSSTSVLVLVPLTNCCYDTVHGPCDYCYGVLMLEA